MTAPQLTLPRLVGAASDPYRAAGRLADHFARSGRILELGCRQGLLAALLIAAGEVVILDVLHYIDYADQRRVLEKVHRALAVDGVLLLRIGNADGGFCFKVGTWVDRMVLLATGRGLQQLHCRSKTQWREFLSSLGFDSNVPMSAGTPFANVWIVARPRSYSSR